MDSSQLRCFGTCGRSFFLRGGRARSPLGGASGGSQTGPAGAPAECEQLDEEASAGRFPPRRCPISAGHVRSSPSPQGLRAPARDGGEDVHVAGCGALGVSCWRGTSSRNIAVQRCVAVHDRAVGSQPASGGPFQPASLGAPTRRWCLGESLPETSPCRLWRASCDDTLLYVHRGLRVRCGETWPSCVKPKWCAGPPTIISSMTC